MDTAQKTDRPFRITGVALPYIDNARTVTVTLLLNLVLTWLFGLRRYEVGDIVIDAVICALLTVVIDVLVVWRCMKKARRAGAIPDQIPVNRLMMLLPKNRFGLIAVFGTIFAVLCVGVNYTVFTWYGFESWTFNQFLAYKLIYSLILSERIVSLCILRFVQPDCREAALESNDTAPTVNQAVKNPLPTLSGLKGLFSSISANLALQLFFNPYVGDYSVDGPRSIVAEGIIASAVTCFIVIGIITKTLDIARANGEFNVPANRFLTRLPKNRWLFAFLCAAVAAGPVGGGLFLFLFRFYGFESWTFYQFFWIKIAWMTVLGNMLVNLALLRFTQPDIRS